MGKKIDLNTPRTSSSGPKQRRTNHSFSHPLPSHINNQNPNPNELEDQNNEQQANNNPSAVRKKGTEIGLRAAGVPKGMAKAIAKDNRTYELDDKIKATIKFPIAIKVVVPLILFLIPVILLMLFVTLFQDDNSSINNGGIFAYGKNCSTVTVINTDCDSNAKNCKHTYDGEVAFEDYIAGVVAAEVEDGNDSEFYKVAAIIARNYFLNNASDDCEIEGNAKKQAYKDVEASAYSEKIKQTVEETRGLVLVKDEKLATTFYASACVVNADDNYYYVRYGTYTLGNINYQKISKNWAGYPGVSLSYWYSLTNQSDTNYDTKSCPNNHDYGMTQIGAYYLATEENYNYEEIIKYYFGDVEIKSIYTAATGNMVEGFITPVNNFSCSNGYGCRFHPIYNYYKPHTGVDLGAASGEPIYAAKAGTITYLVKSVPGYDDKKYTCGNNLIIDHGDGTKTRYCHMLYGSIPGSLSVGSTVEQGEMIGEVGSTGASTGPHLHYEVYVNESLVNPYYYMDLSNVSNASQCNSNASVPMSYCN